MVKKYKHTEIGMIPHDWDFAAIGPEIDLLTGFPFKSGEFTSTGIKLLRGSNVKRNVTDWTDDNTRYWKDVPSNLKQYMLQEGDIVIAMDGSLVGKSFARLSKKDLPALLVQRIARVRSANIDPGYLKELICSDYFTKHCDSVKTTSAIPHISPKDIRTFEIPIPPTKAEQVAISGALNSAELLITALEKITAKKRAMMQGAMQELLRPKAGWQSKKLGTVGKIYGGLSGKSSKDFKEGNSPYLPFMNVMTNVVIDRRFLRYVSIQPGEKQNQVIKGDLLFNGSSESPEELGMCSILLDEIQNLYLNSFCFGLRLNKELRNDGLYLAYYFRSSYGRKIFMLLSQGATRHNLSKTNFLKTEIQLPLPEEQVRISAILSAMGAEIKELENQLAKQKLIRQGMRQQLLTGKIRLVRHD